MNTIFNLMSQRASQLNEPQYTAPKIMPNRHNIDITKYYDVRNKARIQDLQKVGKENNNKTFHNEYIESLVSPSQMNLIKNALLKKRMRELSNEYVEGEKKTKEINENADLELLFNNLSDKVSSGIFDVVMMEEIHKILNIFQTESYLFSSYLIDKYLTYFEDIESVIQDKSTQYLMMKNKKDKNISQFILLIFEKCINICKLLKESFQRGETIIDRKNALLSFNKDTNLKKIDTKFIKSYETTLKELEASKDAKDSEVVNVLKDLRKTMLMTETEKSAFMGKILSEEADKARAQEEEERLRQEAEDEIRRQEEALATMEEDERTRLEEERIRIEEANKAGEETTLKQKVDYLIRRYENEIKINEENINYLQDYNLEIGKVYAEEFAKLPFAVKEEMAIKDEKDVLKSVNKKYHSAIKELGRIQGVIDENEIFIKDLEDNIAKLRSDIDSTARNADKRKGIEKDYNEMLSIPLPDLISLPDFEYLSYDFTSETSAPPSSIESSAPPSGIESSIPPAPSGGVEETKDEGAEFKELTLEEQEKLITSVKSDISGIYSYIREQKDSKNLISAEVRQLVKEIDALNIKLEKQNKELAELEDLGYADKEVTAKEQDIELTKKELTSKQEELATKEANIETIKSTLKSVYESRKTKEDQLAKLEKVFSKTMGKRFDELFSSMAKKTPKRKERERPVLEPLAPVAEFVPEAEPVAEVEASGGFQIVAGNAKFKEKSYPRLRLKFIQIEKERVQELAKDMGIKLSNKEFHTGLTKKQYNEIFFDNYLKDKFKTSKGTNIFVESY